MSSDADEFRIRYQWACAGSVAALVAFLWYFGAPLTWQLAQLQTVAVAVKFSLAEILLVFSAAASGAAVGFFLAPTAWRESRFSLLRRARPPRRPSGAARLKQAGTLTGWLLLILTLVAAVGLQLYFLVPVGWTFWVSWGVAALYVDAFRLWEFPNGERLWTCWGLQWPDAVPVSRRVCPPVGATRDDRRLAAQRRRAAIGAALLVGLLLFLLLSQASQLALQAHNRPGPDLGNFLQLGYALIPFGYLVYRLTYSLLPSNVPFSPHNLPTVLREDNPLLEVVQPPNKGSWGCSIGCVAASLFTPLWPFAIMVFFLPLLPVVFLIADLKVSWGALLLLPWPVAALLLLKRPRTCRWVEFDLPSLTTIEHSRRGGYEFSEVLEQGSRVTGLGIQENARPQAPYSVAVLYRNLHVRAVGGYNERAEAYAVVLRIANALLVPALDAQLNVGNLQGEDLQKELRPWLTVEAPVAELSDLPPVP